MLSFLREGGYFVVFLQETHTDPVTEDSCWLEWGDRVYFSYLTVRTAGVTTLFSPDLLPEVLGVGQAVPGCLLYLQAHMEGLVVNLINVHVPTSDPERLHFYQQASACLGSLEPPECLVLGGDFNATLEERDRSGTEQSPAAMDFLRKIVEHHSLLDVWHDHHPDDISTFTFVPVEAHWSCHSRYDHIYLSCVHLSRAHSSSIRQAPFLDHYLATVTASLYAETPGLAYWHFNNSFVGGCGLRGVLPGVLAGLVAAEGHLPLSVAVVGCAEGARQALLPQLHLGHQPMEGCGNRAVGMGGLRAGEASGRQP
ncbi:unnamed protein product [Caretta caretta]